MGDAEETADAIKMKVRALLGDEAPALDVDALEGDDELLSTGLLDSMAIVNLVGALEQAFDLEFDTAELTAERFETLNSMVAFVIAQKDAR